MRFLICADDIPNGQLPQFYDLSDELPPSVKSETNFVSFCRNITASLLKTYRDIPALDPEFEEALGCITFELFKNTDDWATKEWNGVRVNRSIRGVRLELIRGSRDRLLFHVGECATLREYISQVFAKFGNSTQPFLEVSVFDSGSGIAAVYKREPLPPDAPVQHEYRQVIKALEKWSSTSSKTHRGIGLYRVMRTLTDNFGLLRLRTGRLNLVRNFFDTPYTQEYIQRSATTAATIRHSLDMVDWSTGNPDIRGHAGVEGTLFSILLPMKTSRG